MLMLTLAPMLQGKGSGERRWEQREEGGTCQWRPGEVAGPGRVAGKVELAREGAAAGLGFGRGEFRLLAGPRPGREREAVCALWHARGAETRSPRKPLQRTKAAGTQARGRSSPGPGRPPGPAPPRPWGILGAGRGGGGPFKRRSRPQGQSGGGGLEARSAPQRPAASRSRRHGRSAAARPAVRRAGLHPGLRGGAGEVQRYGAVGPGRSSSLTARPLTSCPRWPSPSRPRQSPAPVRLAGPRGLGAQGRGRRARRSPRSHALNRALRGAGRWGGPRLGGGSQGQCPVS